MLFHNDLENTTQALPELLTILRDEGYEFVPVSELIYHEDYTINSDGRQVASVRSSAELTPANVEEVMSQYAEEIAAAGFSEEQVAQAVQLIKDGGELPEEVLAVISEHGLSVPVSGAVDTGSTTAEKPKS